MSGQFTLTSKFLTGTNYAAAEDGLPITVGYNAGRKRIAFIQNPFSQSQTIDLFTFCGYLKYCRHSFINAFILNLIVPT